MFPSTLIGTGEKWTMMKTISVTEYLNYEAGIIHLVALIVSFPIYWEINLLIAYCTALKHRVPITSGQLLKSNNSNSKALGSLDSGLF